MITFTLSKSELGLIKLVRELEHGTLFDLESAPAQETRQVKISAAERNLVVALRACKTLKRVTVHESVPKFAFVDASLPGLRAEKQVKLD